MKASSLVLLASIAINLALGYYWLSRPATAESDPVGARIGPAGSTPGQSDAAPGSTASNSGSGAGAETDSWQLPAGRWEILLAPDNLSVLADRLRETGMPPTILRSVLQSLLLIQYGPASVEILGPVNPFWQPSGLEDAGLHNPSHMVEYRKLVQEMDERLRAALGDDYYRNPDALNSYRRQYGDLSDDRLLGIARIQNDYSQRMTALLGAGGIMDAERRSQLTQAETDRQAAIEAYLTPAEFEEYSTRNSGSASTLRNRLAAFKPTEEEFRALVQFQLEFDRQYPATSLELSQERAAHQDELNQRLQSALPPDRVEAFQLSQLPGATQVSRLVERLELPADTTWQLLRTQQEIQSRAQAIQVDPTLDPATKAAQLGTLATEASSRLNATLGDTGFELYRQNAATWLNALSSSGGRGGGTAPAILTLPF